MSEECGYIQFLTEARSGGQAALGRLAVLVRERLYPFVLRMTQDRDATEDIIQETLLTMLRRLGALRDGARFWPWIYRIAWSRVQDRVRSRRQASRHETTVRRQIQDDEPLSGDGDPLETQVRAESLRQVSVAMAQLHPWQRDILHLRCYEELPYTEIAARTHSSPQEARVRFYRAKKSLQAQLVSS